MTSLAPTPVLYLAEDAYGTLTIWAETDDAPQALATADTTNALVWERAIRGLEVRDDRTDTDRMLALTDRVRQLLITATAFDIDVRYLSLSPLNAQVQVWDFQQAIRLASALSLGDPRIGRYLLWERDGLEILTDGIPTEAALARTSSCIGLPESYRCEGNDYADPRIVLTVATAQEVRAWANENNVEVRAGGAAGDGSATHWTYADLGNVTVEHVRWVDKSGDAA